MAATVCAVVVSGGVVVAVTGAASGDYTPGPQLVMNGSFEAGLTGWRTNSKSATSLDVVTPGVQSQHAAQLTAVKSRNLVLNDTRNTVQDSASGVRYRVSARVRSASGLDAELRVREVSAKGVVVNGQRAALDDPGWHVIAFEFTVQRDRSDLDLNVVGWLAKTDQQLEVDRVSMVELIPSTGSTPSTTPPPRPTASSTQSSTVSPSAPASASATPSSPASASPPAATTAPPSASATASPTPSASPTAPTSSPTSLPTGRLLTNGCAYSERGIPACGAYFGAAVGGNADPSALESLAGRQLGVHRTFWQGSQVTGAVAMARADLAAGRLPWLSFKLPASWSDMAAGAGDQWAADLADRLSQLDGPVWVAFHHEPETDGDMVLWTRIQQRLAPIVHSHASNVAFTIILTGWHQTEGDTASYGLDKIWPANTQVDLVGFDLYNRYGTPSSNRKTPTDMQAEYFAPLAAWAKAHGIPWGIGEIGYTDATAAVDPGWLRRTYSQLVASGGVAMSYFDSSLNATGDWLLDTPDRRQQFVDVMKTSPAMKR